MSKEFLFFYGCLSGFVFGTLFVIWFLPGIGANLLLSFIVLLNMLAIYDARRQNKRIEKMIKIKTEEFNAALKL